MSDPDALNVWNGHRLIGRLRRDSFGHIGFRYDPEWLSGGGFAISQTLPLGAGEFTAEEGVAHRFFANLLPESGFRERIVRDLKISDTDFNLLRAIGGECGGALSVLPEQQKPSAQRRAPRTNLRFLCGRGSICFRKRNLLRATYSSLRLQDIATFPPTKPLPRCSPGLSVCRSSTSSCSLSTTAFIIQLWSATTDS